MEQLSWYTAKVRNDSEDFIIIHDNMTVCPHFVYKPI